MACYYISSRDYTVHQGLLLSVRDCYCLPDIAAVHQGLLLSVRDCYCLPETATVCQAVSQRLLLSARDCYYGRESGTRGYLVYQAIWTAAIGEELVCQREPSNVVDRYALAVIRSDIVIGHLPERISHFALSSSQQLIVGQWVQFPLIQCNELFSKSSLQIVLCRFIDRYVHGLEYISCIRG